jgi:hypothetical protein
MEGKYGRKKKKKIIISSKCERPRAQSNQQKFSDLRNFLKKSENFKPAIFVRKVRKII